MKQLSILFAVIACICFLMAIVLFFQGEAVGFLLGGLLGALYTSGHLLLEKVS